MTTRYTLLGALAGVTLSCFAAGDAQAQGCVAVRPMGCSSTDYTSTTHLPGLYAGEWQLAGSYQYFRSFRHFRGAEEETHRVEEGTEVVNVNHAANLSLGYGVTDRIGLTATVPLIYYDRSSLYEHYGNSESANPTGARFHTGASGIGDLRVAASYWLFDPMRTTSGNVALGFGIKAPTGDANVTDTFRKMAADGSDSLVTKAVDQSIQLGDGGWGFILQGEGFRTLFPKGSVYFNGFYLFNPRDVNDTPHNSTTFHSVADQYSARAGLSYALFPRHGFSVSLGGRLEGVPSEDLIGGSDGRRRPGYIWSIEPGVSYRWGTVDFALDVPIALYRNRTQSVSDRERTAETGEWVQGDAAFADYLVNFTISTRFGSSPHQMMEPMGGDGH